MLQHACIFESLSAVCVHLGTWKVGVPVSQHAVLGKAGLTVNLVHMYRGWGLAKNHLA